MSIGVLDIAASADYLLALNSDGLWLYADLPESNQQPTWEVIPGLATAAFNLRYAGDFPLLVGNDWVQAGLLNNPTTVTPAIAVYKDPTTGDLAVKTYANRFPAGLPDGEGTTDSMPLGAISVQWGDFHLLGDIQWKRDQSLGYASTNTARFPHAIWRSRPAIADSWNPDDIILVGQRSADNRILGMFVVDGGLLVYSSSVIALLRGTPDDFIYDELRVGISPTSRYEIAQWSVTGLVVWIDERRQIWATNGESFSRIDDPITLTPGLTGQGAVVAIGDDLLVSGGADVRVLRNLGEKGAWTTLVTPSGWRQAVATGSIVIGVGTLQEFIGTFILDDAVFGRLDANTPFLPLDPVVAYDLDDEENRGKFDGQEIAPIMRSRPLPGASDSVLFWHRFGIRANGPGTATRATAYPGAEADAADGYTTENDESFEGHKSLTFPAHGPSLEAVFEIEFEGDVTPEHMTVAVHRGRDKR